MILKAFDSKFFSELKGLRKNKLLFFNGCFDILHLGHIRMINEILELKKHGYFIICGLNSDVSVALQNKKHPLINDENTRAEILIELGIDYVILFDEKTPKELLMYLIPDLVFKGSDYEFIDFYEKDFLIDTNCRIRYFPIIDGYSTTNIYNKIEEHVKDKIRRSI